MRAPVSVCMIARDEEGFIGDCLASIRPHVEEIVVLDTGSSDRTPDIAASIADRVERDTSFLDDEGFIRDFSEARRASYSLATQPWHMWLDADDIVQHADVLPELVAALDNKRITTGNVHVGSMRYLYTFNADGTCSQDFMRVRLTPAGAGFGWQRVIHEYIDSPQAFTRVPCEDAPLIIHRGQHKPNARRYERNERILRRVAADPSNIDPMMPYYLGNTLAMQGRLQESDRWLEQCLAMPGEHIIKRTAHKHLHNNAYFQSDYGRMVDVTVRFLQAYPSCASAYFCAARTTLRRIHGGVPVTKQEISAALGMLQHALTLSRKDDDVFFNPWEWDVWAPHHISLLKGML